MDLTHQRSRLDAPSIPEIDGELDSRDSLDGQVRVEVIEHLRVKVPAAARQAWLEAEKTSWEPWLRRQRGFLGRELRWDAERQEGQLLIRWASRAQWHAIPRAEIEQVQERFERDAHAALVRLGVLPPLGTAAEASTAVMPAALADTAAATAPATTMASASEAGPHAGEVEVLSEPPALRSVSGGRPANPFPLLYSGELHPDAA